MIIPHISDCIALFFAETFNNPLIFADVPDEDIIRVGDTYYMISTTMHLSPGAPIMKSYFFVTEDIENEI